MDQILGILIVALVISIVVGAIASGLQRLLGFAIIAAIATALIGMATGNSFSLPNALPNVVGSIQPNSGLPDRIETINPAAGDLEGSGSTSANAFNTDQPTATNAGDDSAPTSTATTATTDTAGSGATSSGAASSPATTAPTNTSRPVNALW
ncbi:MAG: hypothetical protein AAF289_17415 [Cyanobacteria bacterium P01_A01_bin.135]